MSTHPNALLLVAFSNGVEGFDKLAAKLGREGMVGTFADKDEDDESDGVDRAIEVKLGKRSLNGTFYRYYDDGFQIGPADDAEDGETIFSGTLTYGYGETLDLEAFNALIADVHAWANPLATELGLTYKIRLSANYW